MFFQKATETAQNYKARVESIRMERAAKQERRKKENLSLWD
jgi:hypothetical protein